MKIIEYFIKDWLKDLKWAKSSTKFSFIKVVNRAITASHVTKMAKSVLKNGIVRPVIVRKSANGKELEVIDGQHLLLALLRLGHDNIPYLLLDPKNDEELITLISDLNTSSKSWSLKDFIKAWGHIRKEYRILSTYMETYDIETVQLASILYNQTARRTAGGSIPIAKIIKKGTFTISNITESRKLLDYITQVLEVVGRMDRIRNVAFIYHYVEFVKSQSNYNHSKFLKNLKKNVAKYILATGNPEEFKKLIENTYKL